MCRIFRIPLVGILWLSRRQEGHIIIAQMTRQALEVTGNILLERRFTCYGSFDCLFLNLVGTSYKIL